MQCVCHQVSTASLVVLFFNKNMCNQPQMDLFSATLQPCQRHSQHGSVLSFLPWKNPTSWLVGSVIPSSHKGHTCEWCWLGFHTKEPQQASINGRQTAELCSNVPSLWPLDGWVNRDKTLVLGPPAVHLMSEFFQITKTLSHFTLMLSNHADSLANEVF